MLLIIWIIHSYTPIGDNYNKYEGNSTLIDQFIHTQSSWAHIHENEEDKIHAIMGIKLILLFEQNIVLSYFEVKMLFCWIGRRIFVSKKFSLKTFLVELQNGSYFIKKLEKKSFIIILSKYVLLFVHAKIGFQMHVLIYLLFKLSLLVLMFNQCFDSFEETVQKVLLINVLYL